MEKKDYIPNFKIPANYFNNFEARLFVKFQEEKFPKSSGFTTPEFYFENLEIDLFEKTTKKDIKIIKLFSKKSFYYASAIAASLIIAISIFKFSSSPKNIETIELSIIDSYIEEGHLDIDLYDLTNYLQDVDTSELDLEPLLISDDKIKEYLYENMENEFWIYGGID